MISGACILEVSEMPEIFAGSRLRSVVRRSTYLDLDRSVKVFNHVHDLSCYEVSSAFFGLRGCLCGCEISTAGCDRGSQVRWRF